MSTSNERNLVFVSHANPEDNEFCRWLSLRLAREGYPVWLDFKRLLGGENFWRDIENAIRNRAVKVLFALSKTSNVKEGPQKELALAQTVARITGIQDFVIPLRIDDLPFKDLNINLHQLNTIVFDQGWSSGFQQLLAKLEKDNVTKDPQFTPDAVTNWWRTQFSADAGILAEPEECLSNWFQITKMPAKLYVYEGTLNHNTSADPNTEPPFPSSELQGRHVSFANPNNFSTVFNVTRSVDFETSDVLEGILDERYIPATESKKIISYLLVDNWRRMMRQRGMMMYQLSNHRFCGALRQNQLKDDKVHFTGIDGKSAWRGVVGYKTMRRPDGASWVRFWHFGVQARAQFMPVHAFLITPHVIFSENGQSPWDSKDRQHSARRSQCKNWWNDDWRDRILALMYWLAEGSDVVTIDCGGDVIEVQPQPLTFTSPVRYGGTASAIAADADERELIESESDTEEDDDAAPGGDE